MRRSLKRFLPDHEAIHNNRWFAPFANTLLHPRLWHLNRRSAAGAVGPRRIFGRDDGADHKEGPAGWAGRFRG
jgi:hypothetical protein